jgi:predicted DNA-binding transcriptional regulator AlpA
MSDRKSKRKLTTRQVQERYGAVSHMWVERRLKNDSTFPRFVKFGRLRMWDEAELDAWDQLCGARGRGE